MYTFQECASEILLVAKDGGLERLCASTQFVYIAWFSFSLSSSQALMPIMWMYNNECLVLMIVH